MNRYWRRWIPFYHHTTCPVCWNKDRNGLYICRRCNSKSMCWQFVAPWKESR